MILDDLQQIKSIDTQDMYGNIQGLPDQLSTSWEAGQKFSLPEVDDVKQIVIAGMGGSAIGADLAAAYVAPICPVPIFVLRDYDLPAWAKGAQTLVIACSHSGNTEETLSAFAQAQKRGCSLIAISTGGKLSEAAKDAKVPFWDLNHKGQPRAAVGLSFGYLLAIFYRLGLIEDQAEALRETVRAMKAQQATLLAEVQVVKNPAKRLAGQLFGRWVSVFGSGMMAPVARRWKGQISELAKSWAQFEYLPEADHNSLAGVINPPELLLNTMMLFLRSPSEHPRNFLRGELTRNVMMLEGMGTDMVYARGDTPLSHMWTALHFGDYVAFYLAIAYETDPTPVESIVGFKAELEKQ